MCSIKLGLPGEGPFKIKWINTNGSRAIISYDDSKEMEINTARIVPYSRRPHWMTAPVIGDVANPQGAHMEHTDGKQASITDEDLAKEWQTEDEVDILINDVLRTGVITRIAKGKAYVKGDRMNRWFPLSRLSQHLPQVDNVQVAPTTTRLTSAKKRRTTRIALR